MDRILQKEFLILVFVFGSWTFTEAQKIVPPLPTDTLAKVGTTVITARDLIERIELMPWPEKEKPREHDSSKVKALNSIIAERMLAMEGKQFNVGNDEVTQLKMRAMEKLFVRDELFKRKVKDNVKISEEEIRDGLVKFAWELPLVAIGVKDRFAGDSLYRILRRNPDLGPGLHKYPVEFVTVVETVKVNFGGLDTSFEKEVYDLGKKKFSKPFVSQSYGWVVAVLLERTSNPVYEKMTWGDRRYRVDETIRRKKETAAANQYYNSILIPRKAKADSAVFKTFAGGLRTLLLRDSTGHKRSGLFAVTSEDVDELLAIFAPELNKNFIEMEDKAMTFGEVIEAFRNEPFGFPSLDARRFETSLNGFVRTVVQSELVAREGFRQNLQHSEHVRHDLDLWSGYWVSRHFMWILNDTVRVDQGELVKTMMENLPVIGDVYRVNVQEILCDSMTTVERVFESLAKGISLDSLARKYSKRQTWAATGGVSGYFPLSQHPELGCRAMLADTAQLIGPVRLSEGYSIFKVLGKRRSSIGEYPEDDSLSINIRANLPVIGDIYRVNVQEILCDSMTTVERVFESLAKGISLDSLARKYSKRGAWAAAGGVSGYFPLSQHPELGRRAMLADTAELIGPVKLSEGYSIFKVLGKKRISTEEYPEVDSLRINIKANLTARKRQQSMNVYLASLAKKYSVEIYYRNLNAVEIQPANMFTRRIIGFGGVVTAAPMLYPNWEWVKEWRDGGKILP